VGFDPTISSETFGGTDKSWIRTRAGLDRMKPIMLDMSAFNANHVINGRIPSGTALAKITATGLYGPYVTAGAGGLEIGVGFLFEDVIVDKVSQVDNLATAVDPSATLFHVGDVLESKLPVFTGTDGEVDAAFKVDVAGNITFWP